MKKIFLILFIHLFALIQLSAQWSNIHGNSADNTPTVVKAFNDGVYVASYVTIGGLSYPVFTKFVRATTLGGTIAWEKRLTTPGRIMDFDYNPATDELIVVGHTAGIHDGTDNKSFWGIFNGVTGAATYKTIDNPGSEFFRRIIRHPNNHFYILGSRNPTATPSSNDVVTLYELNGTGVGGTIYDLSWGTAYIYTTSPTDDEYNYGMFLYGSDIMLTGTIFGNEGALVQVNVTTRAVVQSARYTTPTHTTLDIHGGIDLGSGYFAIVGEDWANHQAFIEILDRGFKTATGPSNTNASLRFRNISNFKDVWTDLSGNLYTIGEDKNLTGTSKNYQVVHKFSKSILPAVPSATLNLTWARYLSDLTESSFGEGKIAVNPSFSNIFYADTRAFTTPVFGNKDMLVGSYDQNLGSQSSTCSRQISSPNDRMPLVPQAIVLTTANVPLPTPATLADVSYLMSQTSFCTVPTCDFTFAATAKCFETIFTATTMPPGTYTYSWDVDCNGPDGSTSTFAYTRCGGGTFDVCLSVIDAAGNIVCRTRKTITVSSECCGALTSAVATCTAAPCVYGFSIVVSAPPVTGITCSPTLVFNNSTSASAVSVVPIVSGGSTTGWTITGTSQVPCASIPTALSYTVNFNCFCPSSNTPITCSLPVRITTPCCKEITVADQVVCKTAPTLDVPITVSTWPPLTGISSVAWYVIQNPTGGPCPAPSSSDILYQFNATTVLEPLHLYPVNLLNDVCVYAVVTLNDGNCTVITSNVASINRCEPSSYSLLNYEYCYTPGTPVTPSVLGSTPSPRPPCPETVAWYFNNSGPALSTGSYTYTPPPLSMTDPTQCYQDFIYTMRITDGCGTRNYNSRIRLFSNSASIGALAIDPLEPYAPMTLLCNGEDLTLTFTPNCASHPPLPATWTWYKKDCVGGVAGPPVLIPTAGTMNGVYNTNRLRETTWFGVTAANGVCPTKSVEKLIEVKNLTALNSFTVVPADACLASNVRLTINFTGCTLECTNGACACDYQVEWFKDGVSIGTTTSFFATGGNLVGTLTYPTQPLAGNYYAVLKTCCNEILKTSVVTITPTCKPKITGPCFICRNQPVVLTGAMVLPVNQPCTYGASCSFAWSVVAGTGGVISGSTTGSSITVTAAGTYQLTTTCTTPYGICVQTVQFVLPGCSNPLLCACPSGVSTPVPNMVLNGDFSMGNAGFSSGLTYSPGVCSPGFYGVTTSFAAHCTTWGPAPLPDHTTGSGKYLIIDGATTAGETVLWKSAPVYLGNSKIYCFSFWWASLYTAANQNFPVRVDVVDVSTGAVVHTIGSASIAQTPQLVWQESSMSFLSGLSTGYYALTIRQLTGGAFRDFGIDDICMQEIAGRALSVDLLNFSGKAVGKQNLLTWTTSSEKKASHFSVEQSADGITFQAIGTVKAIGKPSSTQDYVYFHEQPQKGLNYYRLKMVDLDGYFEYSNIVSISRERDKAFSVQKLGNDLIFKGLEADTEVDIVLVDVLGRIVFTQKNRSNTEGVVSQAIPDVAFGIYVASARSKQKVYSGKVLIENK